MSGGGANPVGWFEEIAIGLSLRDDELILMVWAYYDESGEYDHAGRLVRMTVGGCIAPLERWKAFEAQWKEALAREGLEGAPFRMSDFEAWRPPFDFKTEDGSRDKTKHNRLLNSLLECMIEHIEGIYGFSGNSLMRADDNAHKTLLGDSIAGAVKNAVVETWTFYEKPITLVFDQQTHLSLDGIKEWVAYYNLGVKNGRIKNIIFGRAAECAAIQAADIIAYEMSKIQPARSPAEVSIFEARRGGAGQEHDYAFGVRTGANGEGQELGVRLGGSLRVDSPERPVERTGGRIAPELTGRLLEPGRLLFLRLLCAGSGRVFAVGAGMWLWSLDFTQPTILAATVVDAAISSRCDLEICRCFASEAIAVVVGKMAVTAIVIRVPILA